MLRVSRDVIHYTEWVSTNYAVFADFVTYLLVTK